jgi:hypothetical protein
MNDGNPHSTSYKAAVMQARAEGADIEARVRGGIIWHLCTVEPAWNWVRMEYRVAEHRVPVEGYAVIEMGDAPFTSRRALLVYHTADEARAHARSVGMDKYDVICMREVRDVQR